MIAVLDAALGTERLKWRGVLVFQDQMTLVPFSSRRSKASDSPSSFDGLLGNVSVLERLDELRRRLVHSALAVSVGVLAGFAFINQVVTFILGPTRRALPSGTRLSMCCHLPLVRVKSRLRGRDRLRSLGTRR